MNPSTEERHPLLHDTLPIAAQIAARAFLDDPFFAWLFPHDPTRLDMLCAVMRAMVGMRVARGSSFLDRLVDPRGVVATEAPGSSTSKLDEVRAFLPRVLGLLPSILRGPSVTEQLRRAYIGLAMLEELAGHRPRSPHCYIAVLSVDPVHQGMGVGGQLLRSVLADADREQAPAHLETSRFENQAYYARFGFKTVHEVRAHGAPPVWIMARAAARAV